MVKNPPAMWKTWVGSLGWEDPLEKGKATHSSTLAWWIQWTKERGRLQSMRSLTVGYDWATFTFKDKNKGQDNGKTSLKLYASFFSEEEIYPNLILYLISQKQSYSFHKYLEKYIEKSRLFVSQLERFYFIWAVRFYFSWHPQDPLRPESRWDMSIGILNRQTRYSDCGVATKLNSAELGWQSTRQSLL